MWVLDDDSPSSARTTADDDYNKPPYNRYTIIRAQFDKWFSSKVREAGALLICETTVEELLMDGDQRASACAATARAARSTPTWWCWPTA